MRLWQIRAYGLNNEPIFESRLVRHFEQNSMQWVSCGVSHSAGLIWHGTANEVIEFLMRYYENTIYSIQTNTGQMIIPENLKVIHLRKLIIAEIERDQVE